MKTLINIGFEYIYFLEENCTELNAKETKEQINAILKECYVVFRPKREYIDTNKFCKEYYQIFDKWNSK